MANQAELAQPLLGRRAPARRRQQGWLAPGSVTSGVVLQCAASVGTGVLALPYGVSVVGVWPALLLFSSAAVVTYVSNIILSDCVAETKLGSYGELMTGILGTNGALVLNAIVCAEGIAACSTYLVFIMDYVPQLCNPFLGEESWCTDKTNVANAAFCVVLALTCMRGLSALRYVSTCSLITIVFTCVVVVAKTPMHFGQRDQSLGEVLGESKLFQVDACQVLSMACFAFMTHSNTPENVHKLGDARRGTLVIQISSMLLLLVYGLIAVCGHLSFYGEINQDFLTNYELRDRFIVLCRCLLSATLVFACPINLCPGMQAFFNILDHFNSSTASPSRPQVKLYDSVMWRMFFATVFCCLSHRIAVRSPHVADLISTVCAFTAAPLMFLFPALMYKTILKRQGNVVPAFLVLFTVALVGSELYRCARDL